MAPLILVIDNDLHTRRMLLVCLNAMGFRAFGASNSHQSLALIGSQAPKDIDGILLNLEMLGLDGVKLLQILQEQHADIPVIIMSSLSNRKWAKEFLGKSVRDYVLKPFDIDLLQKKCLQHFIRLRDDAV